MSILSSVFGDANARYIKSLKPLVERINSLEKEFEKLSDAQLKEKSQELKKRLSEKETPDDILPEAFAAVREAARRTLGQRHFDVQLMGGVVLHRGKIAEMRTGEGKTLVATLPAYLNALEGKGVHVITVNDYLARRDVAWMGQVYDALGLSVGCINHDASYLYDPLHTENQNSIRQPADKIQNDNLKLKNNEDEEELDEIRDTTGSFHVVHEFLRPVSRKEAYNADITYGTNNEYGFDYLRDNMAYEVGQMSQRAGRSGGHNFAIVDEVDSILIDEARTPLIISAPDEDSGKLYEAFSKIVPRLSEGDDYTVDEKLKAVSITESGIEKVEKMLGISNIYEEGGVRHVHHLEQALKAQVLFKRDRDYVVKDGEIIIVDEFTGRLMPGRRWSEGLHQAVEAKEGVKIQKESRTLATITFQNYFRMYGKLAGMTGTARTSAEEFHKVYDLDVVSVPTNKPMARKDTPDRIYKTEAGKFRAIAREIKEKHQKDQPVLVGTVSIEKNELLSALLNREGVPHSVLNAKNHEREAEVIAQAGRPGAVTVATNMAGRGVDIMLGGHAPNKFKNQNSKIKIDEAEFDLTEEYKEWEREYKKVVETGGLHVIGTERHEARRIDDQLRGRAGRQGDPGSSNFYVSMEDDLVRVFGGDRLKNLMDRLGVGEDDVIENRFVSRAIEQAQSRIEGHNFDIRKYVLEYDDVMNKHRDAVYRVRKEILFSDNNKNLVLNWIASYVENAEEQYDKKEQEIGPEMTRQLEKFVLLRVIDQLWLDHIEAMEHLRDSVRLRAYGQRDPLIEYKIEAQGMFKDLMEAMKARVANLIFRAELTRRPEQSRFSSSEARQENRGSSVAMPSGPKNIQESRPDITGDPHKHQEVVNEPAHRNVESSEPKIGRNDPCPCGATHSDGRPKKFKRCHGR